MLERLVRRDLAKLLIHCACPTLFCFSVFLVPSLRADGFSDKELYSLFLICRAAMLVSPDKPWLFLLDLERLFRLTKTLSDSATACSITATKFLSKPTTAN